MTSSLTLVDVSADMVVFDKMTLLCDAASKALQSVINLSVATLASVVEHWFESLAGLDVDAIDEEGRPCYPALKLSSTSRAIARGAFKADHYEVAITLVASQPVPERQVFVVVVLDFKQPDPLTIVEVNGEAMRSTSLHLPIRTNLLPQLRNKSRLCDCNY